jgi:flagellar biosynthesis protein FlhB
VVTATLVVFLLIAGFMLGQMWVAGLVLLSSWLPVFLATLTLGYTRSLAASLLTASGLGVLAVMLMHLLVPDLVVWWQGLIEPFMAQLSEQPGWQLDSAQTEQLSSSLALMMTGLLAAGMSFNAITGLFIGRAWQAQLYNPGAFGSEFRELRLGKPVALFTALLIALSLSPLAESLRWLVDCLPVMLVAFGIQGLSIVHAIVYQGQKSKGWLVAMYILLVVMLPQMLMMLATLGVLDQWFNFRKRSRVE